MPRERGQMPYFKDAATPADVADGGGVRGYAATGSSPRAGSAPKRTHIAIRRALGAITSQNGTAPKPKIPNAYTAMGAITSQNGTAPKLFV